MSTVVNTVAGNVHICRLIEPRISADLWLWWFDELWWRWWRVVVFTHFIDDLQLSTKFLITAEPDIVSTLKNELRINRCQQNLRMCRQEIFALVDR